MQRCIRSTISYYNKNKISY